ncbi:FtsW/RodA/SpoVE family cell cycle protein [Marinithermus hydrothermalis]|uniref:Cell cycle protein n=1 Tax=Marinithermus hydrothermalis (strain DSM 14884 / JCM 11576 / T1) TaxID=869210 RepID=F2NML3_MARHT|nr:FtsW/RodA/SpoVE family cell cycle protein [Marinithermus hydrothermalis]AEB12183.1 cell cycle protein [Marinithermus hydrothermalis DSM 14884]
MDPLLALAQLLLVGFSLLGVVTAAPELFQEHALRIGVALLVTVAAALVSPKLVVRLARPFYLLVLVLLIAVLIWGEGPEGVRRWLYLGGIAFQPSELMKLAMVAYLASFFDQHGPDYPVIGPILAVGLAVGLIALEPDFSTAVFHLFIAIFLLLVIGVPWRRLIAIGLFTSVLAVSLQGLYLSRFRYVKERFLSFLAQLNQTADPQAEGFQTNQALEAVLQGGLFGQGPGGPMPFVPAGHNDMIFAAIAFSGGWLAAAVLVLTYGLIFARGMQIAAHSHGAVSVLALGLTAVITVQAAINIGVTLGFLPVTGVALPFVSYGGSATVATGIAFGLLHSTARAALRTPPTRKQRRAS